MPQWKRITGANSRTERSQCLKDLSITLNLLGHRTRIISEVHNGADIWIYLEVFIEVLKNNEELAEIANDKIDN